MAKAGAGIERLSFAGLFVEAVQSEARTPLAPYLLALSVLVLLAEVFVRRFFSGRVPKLRPRFTRTVSLENLAVASVRPERRPQAEVEGPAVKTPTVTEPKPPEPEPATSDLTSALDEARARAKKRTGR
jgi:hypothetical protein